MLKLNYLKTAQNEKHKWNQGKGKITNINFSYDRNDSAELLSNAMYTLILTIGK